jgi:ribosome recycling factor
VVPVPEMTAETKREMAKMAARVGEAAKMSVRKARKKVWQGVVRGGASISTTRA